jgi:cytochrome c oxidase subunit IV
MSISFDSEHHEIEAHIKKHVRVYITVFVALMALTVITVGVSYLKLGLAGGITLALIIASIKASLVACYFMHLISEKKLIYLVLLFSAVFIVGLLALTLLAYLDPITI